MLSVHTLNAGTPGVEVAHDIAHVGFGNRDCNAHDRLVEHRVGFFEGDLEGFATRNFKGDWLGSAPADELACGGVCQRAIGST